MIPRCIRHGFMVLWLGWGLSIECAVFAQSENTSAVFEAITKMKPTATVCTKKQATDATTNAVPVKSPPVTKSKADLHCQITPIDLFHLHQSTSTILVDTRSASEFSQFHIDGAMNVKSHELSQKTFLRDKYIVLIGNGKIEESLYTECNQLKSKGYQQVKVLWGGMPTWVASGYPVLGQPPNQRELVNLTPAELEAENTFSANLVLVTADHLALQKQIKGSMLISKNENPTKSLSAIKLAIKQVKARSFSAAILVSNEAIDLQAIRHAIKPIPILVYTGTTEAYQNYLAQQPAIWSAYARGPKQPPGCGH